GQVVVGAVRDPLQLAPLAAGEAVPVLDVHRPLRVVGELLLRVLVEAQVLLADAQIGVPPEPGGDPMLVPFLVGAWLDEELHLHLLELAGAEDEVARCDLVAERLADLPDPEWDLLPGDRKSTRLNSSHEWISYAVFCLKKKSSSSW